MATFVRNRWLSQLRHCDVHRIMVSLWLGVSFIGLGTTLLVIGPTLLDLASSLSVGIGTLALMFLVRAAGMGCGTVVIGVVLDKVKSWNYSIMALIILSMIVTTAVLPLSVHIAMLGVVMFFGGLASGCLDNGAHTVLLKAWGEKVGPTMQLLHFMFALGAFFSPLIAKPFVSEEQGDDIEVNSSCPVIADMPALDCEECLSMIVNLTCLALSSLRNNCSFPTDIPDSASGSVKQFGWAFWISCSFLIPPLFAFLYYSVSRELSRCFCKRRRNSLVPNAPPEERSKQTSKHKSQLIHRRLFKVPILILLFLFMFIYVGTEVSYGTYVFTFAVKGELCFSKQKAALLASVFWGTFAFTRLFSVVLALLRVPASFMVSGNLMGSLVASTILITSPHNAIAVWVGSAVLGTSFASVYPTIMTWLGEHIEVSGKSSSVVVSGGNLGDILLPSLVGLLIGHVTPDSLVFFTFVAIVVSACIIVVLFIVTHVGRRKEAGSRLQRERTNSTDRVKLLEEEEEAMEEGSTVMSTLGSSGADDGATEECEQELEC